MNTAIPNTYSIQLNAQLSNGYWIQDVYSTAAYEEGGAWEPGFGVNVWSPPSGCTTRNINGMPVISCQSNLVALYPPHVYYGATCGWLIIKIANGIAYFGYSLDGINVDWYYQYPVGNATIVPRLPFNAGTGLVIGGPGANQYDVDFTSANVILALYYWNGSAWQPAPSTPGVTGTEEYVTNAWIYWNNGKAVVSWPQAVNETPSVPSPGFTPP
ncbi:thermopsin family protease [Vulcanisaeta distributa]|uniref:thermopsin family protease n=1 Tax=Vulcanisaeta distributa TaxID=164451 RepID=UPI0006D1EA35|nr:thermopsin family protease [Vulcanisaeta distributa]